MEAHEKILQSAHGYLELGMHREALAELDSLSNEDADRTDTLELRLAILMGSRRWPDALVTAKRLCAANPQHGASFIHAAFCLHELGRTDEAREFLLDGPAALRKEPLYYYNLACYSALLGKRGEAVENLSRSFHLDQRLKDYARSDPDLDSIRGLFEQS